MPHLQKKLASPRSWLEGKRFHDSDECLNWPFAKSAHGYGIMKIRGVRAMTASRVMCALAHGNPPSEAHDAAHSCGNRLCVNPRHLRWATAKENAADMVLHGTDPSGEKNYAAKLSLDDVRKIRDRHSRGGESFSALGKAFGVSGSNVAQICREATWKPDRKLLVADMERHLTDVRRRQGDVVKASPPMADLGTPANVAFAHETVSAATRYRVSRNRQYVR